MNKGDLKPGTRVMASVYHDDYGYGGAEIIPYYIADCENYMITGTVTDAKTDRKQVFVAWDDHEYEIEDGPVDVELLTLESDQDRIEKEFEEVFEKVKEKMRQAAELISEAHEIALEGHAKDLASMYGAVSPLVNAMDNSGWRSSSWGC
jgi:hypothetical protein